MDGVLALPIAGVPASPEPSPRVISVGGDNLASSVLGIGNVVRAPHILGTVDANGSSPALGIGYANTDGSTRVGRSPVPGENDAALTAPNNQQKILPALILTRSSRRTITMIQVWYRHHSLRRSCVQRNRALHYALAARATQAAITIQHNWLRYLYDSPPLEHHLIPWDDPTLQNASPHPWEYHSSPSSTHYISWGNEDRFDNGIIPAVKSITATVLPAVNSLHADDLPPPEPPDLQICDDTSPSSDDDSVISNSSSPSPDDDSVNSNKSYVELRIYFDRSDSSSSSSFCDCGNCEECCDY